MPTFPVATPRLPNYFLSSLAQTLNVGGNDTSIALGTIYTLDGQVVDTADFATFGRGIVTIDPLNLNAVEFTSFTGITPNTAPSGTITGCQRGLSFKDDTAIPANQKFHVVGAPVLIAFGTHNIIDLIGLINDSYNQLYALIQSVVITGALPATTTFPGISMIANDTDIETGNDERIFDAIEYPLFVLPSQLLNLSNKIATGGTPQTITTAQVIFNTQINGGILGTANAVKVKIFFDTLSLGSSASIVFQLTYGGSSPCNIGFSTTSADPVTGAGSAEFILVATGATNSQLLAGEMHSLPPGFFNNDQARGGGTHLAIAIDSTIAQFLELSCTVSVGSSLVVSSYIIEKIS